MLKIGKGVEFGSCVPVIPSPQPVSNHPVFAHHLPLARLLHATIIHLHLPLIRSHQHPKSPVDRHKITSHLPYLRTRKTPIFNPDFVSGKQRVIVIKYFASIVIFIPIFTQLCLDHCVIAFQKRHRNAQNALFLLILLNFNNFSAIFTIFYLLLQQIILFRYFAQNYCFYHAMGV